MQQNRPIAQPSAKWRTVLAKANVFVIASSEEGWAVLTRERKMEQ